MFASRRVRDDRRLREEPLLFVSVASAHVGDILSGIDLQVDPARTSIETNYGLLLSDGDHFNWVCHEAVTAEGALLSPRYHQTSHGTWLAAIADPLQGRDGYTLFRSTDACSWQPSGGLEGRVVYSVSARGEEIVAAVGADGLQRSTDDGLTFVSWFSAPDRDAISILPSAGGWWAAATDTAKERLFIWTQDNAGGIIEREIPRPEGSSAPFSMRLLATEQSRAWLLVDPQGPDTLFELTPDEAIPLDTGTPGAITDLAVDGETVWFIRDGALLFSLRTGGPPDAYPSFPPSLGLFAKDGQLWFATQSYFSGTLLSHSPDRAATFETLAYPDDIAGPLSCPSDSDAARVCEPLWAQLLPRIRGFDDPVVDTGSTPFGSTSIPPHPEATPQRIIDTPRDTSNCRCTQRSPFDHGAAPLWLFAGLAGYSRRRR